MTEQITLADVPPLFDSRGIFMPVAEDVLDHLPDTVVALYQKIADAYTETMIAENNLAALEMRLRGCVEALNEARSQLAAHRVDAVSETKKWIESQRRFG